MAYLNDNALGKIGERAVQRHLGTGWRIASREEQQFGDVLPVGDLRAGVEVKVDALSEHTGNVAFEVGKLTNKGFVDSGIAWTVARLTVYLVPEINGSYTGLVFSTPKLVKLLETVTRETMGGDRNAFRLKLVTREPAHRWADDVVPDLL